MPRFSPRSLERLNTCDPRLIELLTSVVVDFDCTILGGHRGESEQNRLYDEAKSKVRWPDSKHNASPSLAVDVAPYPIDWQDRERFIYFGGYVKGVAATLDIPIRWGGDWDGDNDLRDQTFMDLVHFELTPNEAAQCITPN